ncbi:effector-associated constant component EACC1 [Phytomonospora endophytica]|uniref:Uncharacterized protein n=1 Tax=Phytomonospora endophytica TaxID=714109 RepID=A0A841FWH3_9ACTN|nr:hypothetical protein [Phytomonospora endophytica]MBB6039103.1 hypothetical protein [Phytomonospora endophytica]GIG65568.1 hypothetical protein Pen01_18630 [Phytomonospora endophytica]
MIAEALMVALSSGAALGGLFTAVAAWRSARRDAPTVTVKVTGSEGERTVTISGASRQEIEAMLQTLRKEPEADRPETVRGSGPDED